MPGRSGSTAAAPSDMETLDGRDNRQRVKLIADQLKHWRSIKA
jgi:hypothetical protein